MSPVSRWVGMGLLAVAVAACGSTTSMRTAGTPGETFVAPSSVAIRRLNFDGALPTNTVTDWVTYGDAYLTFVVTRTVEVPPEDSSAGGRLIEQDVDIEVRAIAWQRQSGPVPPRHLTFRAVSAHEVNGERVPAVAGAAPVLEIGRTFAGIFALFAQGWFPLEAMATLDADGRTVVPAADPSIGFSLPLTLAQFAGLTPAEIGATLAATAPDPIVVGYEHLDPLARYHFSHGLHWDDPTVTGADPQHIGIPSTLPTVPPTVPLPIPDPMPPASDFVLTLGELQEPCRHRLAGSSTTACYVITASWHGVDNDQAMYNLTPWPLGPWDSSLATLPIGPDHFPHDGGAFSTTIAARPGQELCVGLATFGVGQAGERVKACIAVP